MTRKEARAICIKCFGKARFEAEWTDAEAVVIAVNKAETFDEALEIVLQADWSQYGQSTLDLWRELGRLEA